VVVARSDRLYLDAFVCEEVYTLRVEMRLEIVVTQRANFLSVHPIEKPFFASVSPRPDRAVLPQSHGVIFAEPDILNPNF
jgi:hypothetical protein